MQSKGFGRTGLIGLVMAVTAGSGLAGCAAERDPIDRTQAGVVDKTFFLGQSLSDYKDDPEFRTKSYNIDSGANTQSASATIGGANAIERIRWEVTETQLLARRSYQESPGADNRGLPRRELIGHDAKGNSVYRGDDPTTVTEKIPPGTWEFPGKADGTIIAAYKIEKHFDIRRAYNPQTGEEQNIIEENDTDRPWDQRQYMRIDWSSNQVDSTSSGFDWIFGEGHSASAVAYSPTNDGDEDRPHLETDNGYFDVTNKYLVNSEVNPEFGISDCVVLGFFNGDSAFDCTPTEVKVRHSFVRVTASDQDFEPFEESNAPLDIVGNWVKSSNNYERGYGAPAITTWDPQYGYTDAQTKNFFAMHNIWEKSHQDSTNCQDNTDKDNDGTADACTNGQTGYAGSSGSQCDVHVGKCTIPVRDREVKTMGYWLNTDAPLELQDEVSSDGKSITRPGALEEITVTWNQLLKVAVAQRREVECRRTHDGNRADCHALYFDGTGPQSKDMVTFGAWGISRTKELAVDKGKPVITTCHAPVRAYDQPMCGTPGDAVRLGDIRKNYAIYWPYASRAPYGGVATIGADPLTGEMLGETATIMMRSATMGAATERDILQLALGDLTTNDLIAGAPASRYAGLVKSGKLGGALAQGKTAAEISAITSNVQQGLIKAAIGEDAAAASLATEERQLRNAQAKMMSSPYSAQMMAADQQVVALTKQLTNTPFMANLANRGLLKLLAESQDKSGAAYDSIRQFAAQDPSQVQDLFDRYNAYLGAKGICFQDSAASAGAGSIYEPSLAPYFKQLYGSLDPTTRGVKIYDDLLREAVKGIAFHEMGHSLGMRHNFASSWDSPNYTPQYWQLRTNEGRSTASCAGPRTAGGADTCMGPRYLDPTTDDEQGIAGEPRPGIEYFANTSTMEYQVERFGETVGAGTYDLHFMETLYGRTLETFDETIVPPDQQTFFGLKTLSQGIPDDLIYVPNKGYGVHYTKGAVLAKVFDPTRDCRPATDAEKAQAKWRIVHGKVCAPSPKNHLAYEDMKSSVIALSFNPKSQPTSVGINGVRWQGVDEKGTKLVRWQYRYGEDYSHGGYIHGKMFDSGADIYELAVNAERRFDVTYPWQYFRRQNKEFAWWSIPTTIDNNTYARLRAYHWTTTTDIGRAKPGDLADDDQARPSVMAADKMFNFLQRAILMPEPGQYAAGDETNSRTPKRPGARPIFDVVPDNPPPAHPVAQLGIVDGRFVQLQFDNDRGGSWDYSQYPLHVGFDEEKLLALRELVDSRPTLSTVSRDNALDGRDPYISFRTDTPQAVDRLLGALLSEDWEAIAPTQAPDGGLQLFSVTKVETTDPSTRMARLPTDNILFPNIGYANQIGAGVYAFLFSRFSSDMTLATKLRIRLEGDSGPVIPDAAKLVFVDPVTNHRYFATRFGTETIDNVVVIGPTGQKLRDIEKGIGSRMIQRANELLVQVYTQKLANGPTCVAPAAPCVPVFVLPTGQPDLVLDGNGLPVPNPASTPDDAQALRRYVGLLDGMRQVGDLLGGGPLL
jgi:hypothetical protein